MRAEIGSLSSLMNAKIEAIKENQYVVMQFNESGYKAFAWKNYDNTIALHLEENQVILDTLRVTYYCCIHRVYGKKWKFSHLRK